MPIPIDDSVDVLDTGGSGSGWGWLGDAAVSVFDFLGDEDNDWFTKALVRVISDNPDMDYDELIRLATEQAILNNPNVTTPTGSSRTTFDEETGQPNIDVRYSPQVQALFESVVGNAGAPIDTYRNPAQNSPQPGGLTRLPPGAHAPCFFFPTNSAIFSGIGLLKRWSTM